MVVVPRAILSPRALCIRQTLLAVQRRGFSDSTVAVAVAVAEKPRQNLGEIVRHGKGDAVITLCVGGTDFLTLRSTINANAVLADHVAKAEANKEITAEGAIFIDRDPQHFGMILGYLRGRIDVDKSKNKKSALKLFSDHYTRPKDPKLLQELYAEASHFQIPELENALCNSSYWSIVVSTFSGGGGNPFKTASDLLVRIRASLIAMGTVGTVAFTSNQDWTQIPQLLLGTKSVGGLESAANDNDA